MGINKRYTLHSCEFKKGKKRRVKKCPLTKVRLVIPRSLKNSVNTFRDFRFLFGERGPVDDTITSINKKRKCFVLLKMMWKELRLEATTKKAQIPQSMPRLTTHYSQKVRSLKVIFILLPLIILLTKVFIKRKKEIQLFNESS